MLLVRIPTFSLQPHSCSTHIQYGCLANLTSVEEHHFLRVAAHGIDTEHLHCPRRARVVMYVWVQARGLRHGSGGRCTWETAGVNECSNIHFWYFRPLHLRTLTMRTTPTPTHLQTHPQSHTRTHTDTRTHGAQRDDMS